MESEIFTVKCQLSSSEWEIPQQEIQLSPDTTIQHLKKIFIAWADKLNEETSILPEMIDITVRDIKLFSGDSKPLTNTSDELRLDQVNIQSGDIITVKKIVPDVLIKCKVEGENFTFEDLSCNSTVGDLKNLLFEEMEIRKKDIEKLDKRSIQFLCGYPPKPLSNQTDSLKLYEANILSGDTIIVRIDVKDPSPAPVPFMRREKVPSNNSCLFSSVYFIVCEGNVDIDCDEFMKKSNDLRAVIAQKISEDPEKYNLAILGMPIGKYIEWIMRTCNWGGYIELVILSDHFKFEIVAVDIKNSKSHRFGESKNYKNRVFLLYDGIHYDPLFLEFLVDTKMIRQTIFLASDPGPWDMALELAKEAKSQRQYTDLVNCKLVCSICNEGLHGEKEASQHAMDTGHSNFKEL